MKVGAQRYIRVEYARMRTDTPLQYSPVCQSRRYKTSLRKRNFVKKNNKAFFQTKCTDLKTVRENYPTSTVEQ